MVSVSKDGKVTHVSRRSTGDFPGRKQSVAGSHLSGRCVLPVRNAETFCGGGRRGDWILSPEGVSR